MLKVIFILSLFLGITKSKAQSGLNADNNDRYVLFITSKKASSGQKGYFRLGGHFGYIFDNADDKTPAHEIGTDNGLEFSNKLLKSKKGDLCEKVSLFDEKCRKYNVEHRLTLPATPKTNGMVERASGIIKEATVAKSKYRNREDLEKELGH